VRTRTRSTFRRGTRWNAWDSTAWGSTSTTRRPYGLMNSPNLSRLRPLSDEAAQAPDLPQPAAAARPTRLAEELAMLDCLSTAASSPASRAAFPRVQRLKVRLSESRARFERRGESSRARGRKKSLVRGKFWSYEDVAIWPRPVQQPLRPCGAHHRQQGDHRVGRP